MGHKKKNEKGRSLEDQVKGILGTKTSFGSSRHEAKKVGVAAEYIYSKGTLQTYTQQALKFAHWCQSEYGLSSLSRMSDRVPEYIEKMRQDGMSAWTQKTALSALRKVYGTDCFQDVKTDSRSRPEIKRSRLDTPMARNFSEKNNAELINFCRHTGLRRSELEHLKGGSVVYKEGQAYISGIKGKGGRIRDVLILDNDRQVIERIQQTDPEAFVWGRVHSAANVHGYRADYALELYNQSARNLEDLRTEEKYFARNDRAGEVFDRQALQVVADNLGHSRVSVCVENYLYH